MTFFIIRFSALASGSTSLQADLNECCYTQVCLFLGEGCGTFLILLALIWFSFSEFFTNPVKRSTGFLQVYLGEAAHQDQVIPM